MRNRQGEHFETHHLTCPVCWALPGTSCIDEEYHELATVHPSRRLSVAERNHLLGSGWEPPELAERHRREHDAKVARSALLNPELGPGVTAALAGRRPRNPVEPQRGPGSVNSPIQDVRIPPVDADAPDAEMSTGGPAAGEDTWSYLAAYLGGFPEEAAVPRQELRAIAHTRWPAAADGPLPVSRPTRRRRRVQGRGGGSSRGRRSSQALANNLRSFEDLGLIRRDSARDMIVITDPDGLRRLGKLPGPSTSEQAAR